MSKTRPAGQAWKDDQGKPRLELIDSYAIEQLAWCLTFGAQKYDEHNWRKGIKLSRLLGALLRHTLAYMRGEDTDPESGLSHMAHAMCCVMFILGADRKRTDLDDRYKVVQHDTNSSHRHRDKTRLGDRKRSRKEFPVHQRHGAL